MKLNIENVRSIRRAEIEIGDGITLLAGKMRAGKTSILLASGACLTADRSPLTGKIARDAALMTAGGENQGRATLTHDGASLTLTWKGKAGASSASGTVNVPSCGRIAAGLDRFHELKPEQRREVLARVLQIKPTLKEFRDEAKLRGIQWADSFFDATTRLGQTIESGDLDEALNIADEEAKMAQGVWRQVTGKTWTKSADGWEPDGLGPVATQERLDELRGALPADKLPIDTTCPACTASLRVVGDRVHISTGPMSPEDREVLAAKLAEIEALKAYLAAKEQHEYVAAWVATRDLLKPDGLRKVVLGRELTRFNQVMAQWASALGIVVMLDEDMGIHGNGRPYVALSGSEKWLTDLLLQLAVAELENAAAVVVDGADILTWRLRSRLFRNVLASLGRPVLVSVACEAREDAPDLARANLGRTYWVENGTAKALSHNWEVDEAEAA